MATMVSDPRVEPVTARDKTDSTRSVPWWAHVLWVLAGGALGLGVAAIFAGALHLPRALFVVPYAGLSVPFLYLYVRWSGVDVARGVRQHWGWGLVGAALAGAFVVKNVLGQPASAAPSGPALLGAILWLGLVYGTIDALLLSVLPLLGAWQTLSTVGWTHEWRGRAVSGLLAVLASLAVATVYHLGYPEFRSPGVVAPVIGNGVLSLASLLTMSPIAAVGGHIAMHIAAVLHGIDTTVQLPPHYSL
jgi:hypothetical protein